MISLREKIKDDNWQDVKLGNIAKFLKGKGLPKSKVTSNGKYKCILYGELYTKYKECIKDVVSKTNTFEGALSKKGDVLFPSSTTTVGYDLANATALEEDDVLLGGDIIILRNEKNKFDSNFLAHYLTHHKKREIARMTQGITIIHLYGSSLEKLEIKLPSLEIQKKIAEILSKIDEDIEKTDEIVKKAKKLRMGLMSDLFTKGIGHKKFKKTKLGIIPEEWTIERLDNVAEVMRGKFSHRPRNDKRFYNGEHPFIQTGNVVNCNGKISKYSQTLNEKGLKVSKKFGKGTIVLTIAANIGDTGILEFDSCFPDSLVGIMPNADMDSYFLEFYLRTKKVFLNSIATQSAQKNLSLEKLNPMLLIKPSLKEQKDIADILLKIDNKIDIYKSIKSKLEILKKGLMQDLFSSD